MQIFSITIQEHNFAIDIVRGEDGSDHLVDVALKCDDKEIDHYTCEFGSETDYTTNTIRDVLKHVKNVFENRRGFISGPAINNDEWAVPFKLTCGGIVVVQAASKEEAQVIVRSLSKSTLAAKASKVKLELDARNRTNRYLLAQQLKHSDEIAWWKRRPDGSIWRCSWRHLNSPECNRAITFVATDASTGIVKIVFTRQLT